MPVSDVAQGLALLILEAGRLVQAATPILQRMEQALQALVKDSGHTGYISVLDTTRQSVVVLRVFHGAHALRVVTKPGQRASAAATSTGRALLARFNDAEIDRIFGGSLASSRTGAPQNPAQLKRRLREVRRQGWASALDEWLSDDTSTREAGHLPGITSAKLRQASSQPFNRAPDRRAPAANLLRSEELPMSWFSVRRSSDESPRFNLRPAPGGTVCLTAPLATARTGRPAESASANAIP